MTFLASWHETFRAETRCKSLCLLVNGLYIFAMAQKLRTNIVPSRTGSSSCVHVENANNQLISQHLSAFAHFSWVNLRKAFSGIFHSTMSISPSRLQQIDDFLRSRTVFQACWLHVFMFQTVKKHRCFTNHSSTLRNLKDLLRHTSVHTFSFIVASMLHVLLRLVKLGSGMHHFQIRVFSFLVGILCYRNCFC